MIVEESVCDGICGSDGWGALVEGKLTEGIHFGEPFLCVKGRAGDAGFGTGIGNAGEGVLRRNGESHREVASCVDGIADQG